MSMKTCSLGSHNCTKSSKKRAKDILKGVVRLRKDDPEDARENLRVI